MGQRLVRKICDHCKTEFHPSEQLLMELNLTPDQVAGKTLYYGKGCDYCNNTGYRGRLGIYETMVVDDDMRLRALLERYLTEQGFQVRSVANAEQMDRLLTRESFHLMVLDLMLPGEDGLSICRRLRSQSNPMPIIMVTAKGEEVDRIVGLEIGADDYVFDNNRKRGQETEITRESAIEAQSAEKWMRSVNTDTRDFLRTRFLLEASKGGKL